MANNEIKATVVLTESGMAEIEKKGKSINKQLTDITTNSKAASKAIKSTESKVPYRENVEYGEARAAGGTGAAGRDFAKQARGLGGLVHVYATFAANIFAVTAAFTALDKAYSAIRLEQAADIMSNKVGFSVKNLSKDLQEATGYAISFQEAMQFSSMGLSAGLTGKQITSLTTIAKGAANALGRDMGDAVRRIVQGTAKQEQEILDELGIFVRAKTAYAEYAKKIGVDAGELSASQRVQAYANAVENAGNKWKDFSKIEDPFSKFTASLKEAGTDLLNTINSIIGPVLGFLSQSKSLIEGILLVSIVKLGRMALPHFGEQLKTMFAVDQSVIEKQKEGFNLLIADREQAIEKAHVSKAKLNNSIRQSYTDISTGGINIGQAVLENKPLSEHTKLPTDYLSVRENIARSIHGNIKTETQLEEAKNKKLIWQNSKLGDIKVNKTTLNSLALQAVKLGEAENTRMTEYLALVEKIAMTEAEIIAMKEGQDKKEKSSKFTNTILQAEAYKKSIGIAGATDIGWFSKGGDPGKIKQIWGEMKKSILESEGALGKFMAIFRSFGIVATIALDSIMKAMPYLMAAFAAWELLIKPIIDHYNKANIKIEESTNLLKENASALENSLNLFKSKESSPTMMGEDFLQLLERRAQAISTARESLDKLISDLEARRGGLNTSTTLPTLMPSLTTVTGTSGYTATGGKKTVTVEASEQLKLANSILAAASASDKQSDAYKQLEVVRDKLLKIESNAIQFGKESLKDNQEHINASKELSLALQEEEKAILRKQAALNAILAPSSSAVKSITEYFDKSHEATNQEIADLGIKHPLLQQAYKDQETSIQRLARTTDESQRRIAANSVFADTLEIMNLLPKETETYREALQALQNDFKNIKTPKDLQDLLDRLSGINRGVLGIIQERKTGTSSKDTLLQTKLGFAQEELKLQNLKNQQEERSLGYIKEETLEKTKSKELAIASAEYAKEQEGKTGKELDLIKKRHFIRKEEIALAHEQRLQQAALNKLKVEEIEPAKNALEIAKAEYNYKKATIGTSALEDIKQEAEQRRKEFILRQAEIFKLAGIEKTRAQATLDKDKEIAGISEQTSIIELQKKERQEALNLSLDAYIARQDELIKGEDKLAIYDKLNLNFADIKKAQIDEELSNINKINDINLKLLKTTQLKVDAEKAISDEKKRQHEIDKKKLEEALGTKDYQKVLDEVGGWSTIMFNEAHKRTGDFKDSMRNVITGAFDGLYAGIDTAIDNLTTKWMKSQKISLKDIVLDFRNAAAEEFRKMAADQMKLSARKAVETIILASTGKDIKQKDIPKAQLDYLKSIDETLKKLLKEQQAPTILTTDTMQTEQSIFGKIYSNNQNTANPETTVEGVKTDKTSETIRKIDTEGSSVFNTIFEGIKTQISSIFGDSGILSAGFDLLKNALTSLFSSNSSNTASSTGSTGDFLSKGVQLASTAWDWAGNLFPFENGGIMSQYGALKLNKYANGGIATGPQLALFGEGKRNEAYVPLPDGRSIPVTMNTPTTSQSGNSGPISVSITINTNTGQTDTQVNGKGSRVNAMAEFGALISQKVKEEIINQSRPNGLLNR